MSYKCKHIPERKSGKFVEIWLHCKAGGYYTNTSSQKIKKSFPDVSKAMINKSKAQKSPNSGDFGSM